MVRKFMGVDKDGIEWWLVTFGPLSISDELSGEPTDSAVVLALESLAEIVRESFGVGVVRRKPRVAADLISSEGCDHVLHDFKSA